MLPTYSITTSEYQFHCNLVNSLYDNNMSNRLISVDNNLQTSWSSACKDSPTPCKIDKLCLFCACMIGEIKQMSKQQINRQTFPKTWLIKHESRENAFPALIRHALGRQKQMTQ